MTSPRMVNEQAAAVSALRAGRLVAFPTETVYGLGADATSAAAVARVFAAKRRPPTNPLIVHVADAGVARRYVTAWPERATRLAARFWPGPLTLVLPKDPAIVDAVTAGLPTVGLRVPDHPVALGLLRAFDGPVAAPSANRSNRVSPTTARHVRDELGDAVDLILDGGPCRVGIESTVLDLTRNDRPAILRPGGVSRAQIEAVVGPVDQQPATTRTDSPATAPGQHPVHYAPATPAYRVNDPPTNAAPLPPDVGLLTYGEPDGAVPRRATVTLPDDPAAYARGLYAALRDLDAMRLRAILIVMPPNSPEWAAVRDRLTRASRPYSG